MRLLTVHNQCDWEGWAWQGNKRIRCSRTASQFAVTQRKSNTARIKLWWPCFIGHVYIWCNAFETMKTALGILVIVYIHSCYTVGRLVCGRVNLFCHGGRKTSADICYMVILAVNTHKSALQLLISSSGPFAMLSVFLHWHMAVIYSLLLPATRAAAELGIEPEDRHFSSLTG